MKKFLLLMKIMSLAFVFAIAIHFSYGYLFGEKYNVETEKNYNAESASDTLNNNKYKFRESNTVILWNIWVALTTNVWTRYKQRQENNLYKNVPIVWGVISEKKNSDLTNRKNHMDNIKEYYNVLRTDIKDLLQKSNNRRDTLEAYIFQLKYRYNSSKTKMRLLSLKRAEYSRTMNENLEKIKKIKSKISYDFKKLDWSQTEKNIELLLKAKQDYNYSNAYNVYNTQYLKQYEYLNWKSKKLYDALSKNKEIIIKDAQIVIPRTWVETLKKLDLIIEE